MCSPSSGEQRKISVSVSLNRPGGRGCRIVPPIEVPYDVPESAIVITDDGFVQVSRGAEFEEIGQIELAYFANPAGLVEFIADEMGRTKLRPDHRLIYRRDWTVPAARLIGAQSFVAKLTEITQSAR